MSLSEEVQARVLPTLYKNWRGEIAKRLIIPAFIYFGSTEWHQAEQWLMRARDPEKKEDRDFALDGFLAIGEPQIERVWGDGSTARATKREAAVATLESAGYTYTEGAQLWRPPLGKAPDFNAMDKRYDLLRELTVLQGVLSAAGECVTARVVGRAIDVIRDDHPMLKGQARAGA